ncbi:MAG: hypothetical protein QOJ73_2339, partial [Streptosporangiaceae bacterium]|nr:hypothetical protein [Streptosporangiaceae bacterium]
MTARSLVVHEAAMLVREAGAVIDVRLLGPLVL